jgi:hypothetical protein
MFGRVSDELCVTWAELEVMVVLTLEVMVETNASPLGVGEEVGWP